VSFWEQKLNNLVSPKKKHEKFADNAHTQKFLLGKKNRQCGFFGRFYRSIEFV
jgi:hypothetical protein